MPVSAEPTVLLPITVTLLLCCSGLTFVCYHVWGRVQERRAERADPLAVVSRHCRYCHWGEAKVTEESVRFDGDDIVDIRCFVCRRCGLPHWMVNRTPIVRRAVR